MTSNYYNGHSLSKTHLYPLTDRGHRQAQRNNSHQLWSLVSWNSESSVESSCQGCLFDGKDALNKTAASGEQSKQQSFQISKNQGFQISKNQNVLGRSDTVKESEDYGNSKEDSQRFKRSSPSKIVRNAKINEVQHISSEPHQQSQFQKLKRKSIQKYIKDQRPFTRTMSNSAFKKFYQKPCPQTYGNKNTSQGGAFYGNFMKTHNIQPHTLSNYPQNYQTYTSALNHGKRTKLDLEDRWKRIERQLAKDLDYRQLQYMKAMGEIEVNEQNKNQIMKENINQMASSRGRTYDYQKEKTKQLKSSKSQGKIVSQVSTRLDNTTFQLGVSSKNRSKSSQKELYYIYKYNDKGPDYNCTRYARDRHGITCYVDSAFRQNEEALTNFMKNINPIFPKKCRPDDINIDNIRMQNCVKSKTENFSRHYLIPNVEQTYKPQNYSRKISINVPSAQN